MLSKCEIDIEEAVKDNGHDSLRDLIASWISDGAIGMTKAYRLWHEFYTKYPDVEDRSPKAEREYGKVMDKTDEIFTDAVLDVVKGILEELQE